MATVVSHLIAPEHLFWRLAASVRRESALVRVGMGATLST
jgi:hypothetical protein